MPEVISNVAKMYADNTKVYSQIKTSQDCKKASTRPQPSGSLVAKWLLSFNATKCVVLKIRKCLNYAYTLNGPSLELVEHQKDLGITVANTLKPDTHITQIVKKANQRIGIIKRCFTDLTESKVKTLYQAVARPILEYVSPTCNPHTKKDIDNLEKVQNRCSKLTNPPLSLTSLEDRRRFIDLCEVFKYAHDMYKTDQSTFFTYSQRQLRGHTLKLEKQHCRTKLRQSFFANRVVDDWNSTPNDIVTAPTLTSFKRQVRSLLNSTEG